MNWHLLHIKPLTADYPQPSSYDKWPAGESADGAFIINMTGAAFATGSSHGGNPWQQSP
jgi:hypothetical protein